MKVLHLPTSVAGNAWDLAQGEKVHGLDSHVLYRTGHKLNYQYDINLDLSNVSSNITVTFKLLEAFLKIRQRYDVFHFNFGSSLIHRVLQNPLLDLIELPFYPSAAKLFATYNGCDARQKYPTMNRTTICACSNPKCYDGMCNSGKLDAARQKSIRKMAKYVEHIWALNPDLLHFLPPGKSSFLPYAVPFIENVSADTSTRGKFTIIHAPTNRIAKGSDYILSALERIKKKHPGRIEVLVLENIPHAKAMELYRQADLVIDQVVIGWYGRLAIEVMGMGKPVVCRIAAEDLKYIPAQMAHDVQEAFIHSGPTDIETTVLKAIEDPEYLRRKSKAAVAYAYDWHRPEYVASLTKAFYESSQQ